MQKQNKRGNLLIQHAHLLHIRLALVWHAKVEEQLLPRGQLFKQNRRHVKRECGPLQRGGLNTREALLAVEKDAVSGHRSSLGVQRLDEKSGFAVIGHDELYVFAREERRVYGPHVFVLWGFLNVIWYFILYWKKIFYLRFFISRADILNFKRVKILWR